MVEQFKEHKLQLKESFIKHMYFQAKASLNKSGKRSKEKATGKTWPELQWLTEKNTRVPIPEFY